MTRQPASHRVAGRVNGPFIRHFDREVRENWQMHRVSDRAVGRARPAGGNRRWRA
jgi:hypothetical protein